MDVSFYLIVDCSSGKKWIPKKDNVRKFDYSSAEECLHKCNSLTDSNSWDFDGTTCRIFAGSTGYRYEKESAVGVSYGLKNCRFIITADSVEGIL